MSDDKQTIQTSLFALLKDFLKSPSPEELHSVLAYVLSVGEEKQVTFFLSRDLFFPPQCIKLSVVFPKTPRSLSCLAAFEKHSLPRWVRAFLSGGEGSGRPVRAAEEQPASRAGADGTAGLGGGATVLSAAHAQLWGQGPGESLQGEDRRRDSLVSSFGTILQTFTFFFCFRQILFKLLKSERVSERHKQRVKLKDFGYLGLVCFLEDIPVTMVTVQCLYGQVLATGSVLCRKTLNQVASEEMS